MPHPFKDKLFVFIGNPMRCSRQAARDALTDVGGVIDERITTFTHYIIAFNGAERTKVYKSAAEHDKRGHIVLLNEGQFFDVIEGKAEPPAKKKLEVPEDVIVIPAKHPEENKAESERVERYVLAKKRIKNAWRYGDSLANYGETKTGASPVADVIRLTDFLKDKLEHNAPVCITPYDSDYCSICGKPARVHISEGKSKDAVHLCFDCHNRLMAEITGARMPDNIPKRLSFKSKGGKTHEFEIEFCIYHHAKCLEATEIGETKRKADVYGELDDDFNEMLKTLESRIKKTLAVTYMKKDCHFAGDKAVGYIEYNRERDDYDIIIDGKPYTWAEIENNIRAREGWKIKIEFGDVGDELD